MDLILAIIAVSGFSIYMGMFVEELIKKEKVSRVHRVLGVSAFCLLAVLMTGSWISSVHDWGAGPPAALDSLDEDTSYKVMAMTHTKNKGAVLVLHTVGDEKILCVVCPIASWQGRIGGWGRVETRDNALVFASLPEDEPR